jgi:hypothetical protein
VKIYEINRKQKLGKIITYCMKIRENLNRNKCVACENFQQFYTLNNKVLYTVFVWKTTC